MKKFQMFLLIGIIGMFSYQISAQAKEVRVKSSPTKVYKEKNDYKDYIPGTEDWVVLFEVPENSRAHLVTANGDAEAEILRSSNIDTAWRQGGKRYVHVVTGWRARRGYKGDIQRWGNSLSLQYLTALQPRGPR